MLNSTNSPEIELREEQIVNNEEDTNNSADLNAMRDGVELCIHQIKNIASKLPALLTEDGLSDIQRQELGVSKVTLSESEKKEMEPLKDFFYEMKIKALDFQQKVLGYDFTAIKESFYEFYNYAYETSKNAIPTFQQMISNLSESAEDFRVKYKELAIILDEIAIIASKLDTLKNQIDTQDFVLKVSPSPISVDEYVTNRFHAIEKAANARGNALELILNRNCNYQVYLDREKLIDVLDIPLQNAREYSAPNNPICLKAIVENGNFIFELRNKSKYFDISSMWQEQKIDNKFPGVKGGTGKGMKKLKHLVTDVLEGSVECKFSDDIDPKTNIGTLITTIILPAPSIDAENVLLIPSSLTPLTPASSTSSQSTGTPSEQHGFGYLSSFNESGDYQQFGFKTRVPKYLAETTSKKKLRKGVLVLEDNNINYAIIAKMLINSGYQAHQIERLKNGNEFRVMLSNPESFNAFTLLLQDKHVPEDEGAELLGELRLANKEWFNNGIAAGLSGATRNEQIQQFIDNGATTVLLKPVRYGDLKDFLNNYFEPPVLNVNAPLPKPIIKLKKTEFRQSLSQVSASEPLSLSSPNGYGESQQQPNNSENNNLDDINSAPTTQGSFSTKLPSQPTKKPPTLKIDTSNKVLHKEKIEKVSSLPSIESAPTLFGGSLNDARRLSCPELQPAPKSAAIVTSPRGQQNPSVMFTLPSSSPSFLPRRSRDEEKLKDEKHSKVTSKTKLGK